MIIIKKFIQLFYYSIYTVFLPNLSHQGDSTVPLFTVCDRIFKNTIVTFTVYRYFLPLPLTYTVSPTATVIIVTAC